MALVRDLRWFVPALVASPFLAAAVGRQPILVVAVTGIFATIAGGLLFPGTLPKAFCCMLGFILIGYAFFGRAFAYLGVPPVYIGEMTLGLGLLSALVDQRIRLAFRSPLVWLWLVFALWCASRTIPYLGAYGVDALRDAVTWGYGVFAILVAAFFTQSRYPDVFADYYAKWLPRLVIWIPLGMMLSYFAYDFLPAAPGGGKPLMPQRAGDAGTHLAGAAAFLLLGLNRSSTNAQRPSFLSSERVLWPLWVCAFAFASAINRGGMLAVIFAILTVGLLRPFQAIRKLYLIAALMIALGLVAYASNFTVDFGTRRNRVVSVEQLTENITSIGGSQNKELEGTREWRLAWWGKIIGYTLHGPYFWRGKGFGISLGEDDGFASGNNTELRSPHNGHLTILARAGVPGLLLWLSLQALFGLSMVRGYFRALREGQDRAARMILWVLAYWLAHLVDMTFTVSLEGPQGGIWFWCLFGLGIALLESQRVQQFRVVTRDLAFQRA
jgi:hypothetical protein